MEELSDAGCVHNVSFSIRKGEVLGIAALDGQGQTELLRTVAGAVSYTHLDVYKRQQHLCAFCEDGPGKSARIGPLCD